MPLNITKVAVGCPDADALARRLTGRAVEGETYVTTRYRPTRHAELIGGSLYWIVKHQLIALDGAAQLVCQYQALGDRSS